MKKILTVEYRRCTSRCALYKGSEHVKKFNVQGSTFILKKGQSM